MLAKNGSNLFREFRYDTNKQQLCLIYSENKVEVLDKRLQDSNKGEHNDLFKYISKTLLLISEICQGDAGLIIQYIQNLCSFTTCILAFCDKAINPHLRSLFMDIFKSSYITFDSRYCEEKVYPSNLYFEIGQVRQEN